MQPVTFRISCHIFPGAFYTFFWQVSIGSHCSTGFFRWVFQSRLLCQGMSQVISNSLTSSGENKTSWLIMMHSKRSLTTGWEHFRTVGFHLQKGWIFWENRKRIIIEDPKKARPENFLYQEFGPPVTTTISCPKFLLPPDERSDMQVTCFPAKPCLRAWIPWLPLSRSVPAKHFFWRIFVVHLLCLL